MAKFKVILLAPKGEWVLILTVEMWLCIALSQSNLTISKYYVYWSLIQKYQSIPRNLSYKNKGISSLNKGLPGGSDGKETARNVADLGWIPGLGRYPGGGHGDPLQYSSLVNPMDRGAWWATVHGVTKSCVNVCISIQLHVH